MNMTTAIFEGQYWEDPNDLTKVVSIKGQIDFKLRGKNRYFSGTIIDDNGTVAAIEGVYSYLGFWMWYDQAGQEVYFQLRPTAEIVGGWHGWRETYESGEIKPKNRIKSSILLYNPNFVKSEATNVENEDQRPRPRRKRTLAQLLRQHNRR